MDFFELSDKMNFTAREVRKCSAENAARKTGSTIIGRGEVVGHADLRSCINCGHYDPGLYACPCREPQAERVMDKGKRTSAIFLHEGKKSRSGKIAGSIRSQSRLEALFKESE